MVELNFDFYYSIPFWVCFLVIAIGARLFDPSPRRRAVLLGLASSLMLLAIPRFGLKDLGLILGLSAYTYLVGKVLLRSALALRSPRKTFIAGAGISAVLAFLAFFKYHFIQGFFLAGPGTEAAEPIGLIRLIGVSYFSFRMIHFLVEAYRGKIEGLDPLIYFDYIVFFPAFISGPINRYNHFASQLSHSIKSSPREDLSKGGERIVHGLFKKFVLAQILYPHILSTQPDTLAQLHPHEILLGLYAYALYFYFDFAGYSDLAIGCARILGIELPENFNNPFLKRNIRELWTNWHMSLTGWLVDYIYWPAVRKLRDRDYFRRHPVFLSNLGMIVTFIVCGMWHGEAAHFILWGVYHGVGISILTLYQREKRKIRQPALQRYFRSNISRVLGVFLTFNYFAVGLSLFVLDMEKVRLLLAGLLP